MNYAVTVQAIINNVSKWIQFEEKMIKVNGKKVDYVDANRDIDVIQNRNLVSMFVNRIHVLQVVNVYPLAMMVINADVIAIIMEKDVRMNSVRMLDGSSLSSYSHWSS